MTGVQCTPLRILLIDFGIFFEKGNPYAVVNGNQKKLDNISNVVPVEKIEQDPDRSDVLRVTMYPGIWNNHRKNDESNSNNTHPNRFRC